MKAIDLTEKGSKSPKKEKIWRRIGNITLNMSIKEKLEGDDWLTDNVIFAAEKLLQQQFPQIFGLQNPILQRTATFNGNKRIRSNFKSQ